MNDEEGLAHLRDVDRQFRDIMRTLAFGLEERRDTDIEQLFGVHSNPPVKPAPMRLWKALKAVW
jgi:hypothetical protein